MSSDDQQFLDLLASVPQDLARYGGRMADYIEKYTNAIASDIRDAIDSATWIPNSLRPPRNNAGHYFARAPPPPKGMLEKTAAWILNNRTIIAVFIAFAGTSAVLVQRRRKAHTKKRRAKKLPSGGKKEIVVLASSSFHDPLTKSLAIDLERRGYIVFVTVSSTEEDSLVHSEAKSDIRPLWMDLTSSVPNQGVDLHPNLEPLKELLSRTTPPRSTSPGYVYDRRQSCLTLAGVVLLPGSSGYPSGSLAILAPSDIIDTVNTRLIAPVLTVQQLLPLLTDDGDPAYPPSIVLAYPSIPLSLAAPRQIPEIITTSALSSLAASLRREIRSSATNITLTEIRLGNFATAPAPEPQSAALATRAHWHSSQRPPAESSSAPTNNSTGSSVREFHNAVFDALAPPPIYKPFGSSKFSFEGRKRDKIVYVGSGAMLYEIFARVIPSGLVGRMMGYHRPSLVPRAERVLGADATAASKVWGGGSEVGSESAVWEKV